MAFNEFLADRVRFILKEKRIAFEEKKMMGGLCYLVNGKMLAGIVKDKLMARIGTDNYAEALLKKGCSEMDFTGKPLKGYVFLDLNALDMDEDLAYWIQLCLDFNPLAKASKK